MTNDCFESFLLKQESERIKRRTKRAAMLDLYQPDLEAMRAALEATGSKNNF